MINPFFQSHGDEKGPREPRLPKMESPVSPAALTQLEKVIERLELIIDQETAELRSRGGIDLEEFNNRKGQGLLDLTRALGPLGNRVPDARTLAALSRLRAKLEINRALLRNHVEAVREISTMLCDAIRNLDSDGTYAPSIRRAVPHP
jgi:hypothetical protein